MADPSLALAVQDYVPVLLSAIGWLFVVRIAGRSGRGALRLAAVGAVLVVAGGLARATWKTVVAAGGPDLVGAFVALYPLLAAGYLAIAAALWASGRGRDPTRPEWLLPLAAIAVLLVLTAALDPSRGRLVPLLWLGVATAGSIAVGLSLAARARAAGRVGLALVFVAGIVATLALQGLARSADQAEAIQWVEQGLNSVTQLVLAVAAWRLWRAEVGRPAPVAADA